MENQLLTVHIRYAGSMTLFAMEDSLHTLNDAIATFSREHHIAMSEDDENSPMVKSVSQGSVVVDIVVPIVTTLVPVLYDIIKSKFFSKPKYNVQIYSHSARMLWTVDDNYSVCEEVLKEYVLCRSRKSVNEFILGLCLSLPYSKNSIRMKIQNTKYLLSAENISNTLAIGGLPNCSAIHRRQFVNACKDLGIV